MRTHRRLQQQKKEFSRRLLWTAALLGSALLSALLATVLGYENGYGFWQLIWVLLPLGLASSASLLVVWRELRKLQREILAGSSPNDESSRQN